VGNSVEDRREVHLEEDPFRRGSDLPRGDDQLEFREHVCLDGLSPASRPFVLFILFWCFFFSFFFLGLDSRRHVLQSVGGRFPAHAVNSVNLRHADQDDPVKVAGVRHVAGDA